LLGVQDTAGLSALFIFHHTSLRSMGVFFHGDDPQASFLCSMVSHLAGFLRCTRRRCTIYYISQPHGSSSGCGVVTLIELAAQNHTWISYPSPWPHNPYFAIVLRHLVMDSKYIKPSQWGPADNGAQKPPASAYSFVSSVSSVPSVPSSNPKPDSSIPSPSSSICSLPRFFAVLT
jgi:hypothetical protein